jgi:hypothetical protein
VVFQILQAYGLIATRGHYTIDLVLAVPCAFFADSMAVELLDRIARFKRGVNIPPRATPAEARLVEPAGIVHSVNGVR